MKIIEVIADASYQDIVTTIGDHFNHLRKLSDELVTLFAGIANKNQENIRWMVHLSVGVTLTILAVIFAFFTRKVIHPILKTSNLLGYMAQGNLEQKHLNIASNDEVGKLGHSCNQLMDKLRSSISAISENAEGLASSSEQMSSVSEKMAATAEETATQAQSVSVASTQVSQNLNTITGGAEGMNLSINEIAKNASEASTVVSSAVKIAEETNLRMQELGKSSQEIGDVIKVITSIAEQTNMLALNATIEAARAGEAGKGFAVVATEVKELANQTGHATEDIREKIEMIQSKTEGSVKAIGEIRAIINQISEISTVIASTVEEQSASTSEIQNNISFAVAGSDEIATNIEGVADAAKNTAEGAMETQSAAEELSRMAAELKTLMDQFKL